MKRGKCKKRPQEYKTNKFTAICVTVVIQYPIHFCKTVHTYEGFITILIAYIEQSSGSQYLCYVSKQLYLNNCVFSHIAQQFSSERKSYIMNIQMDFTYKIMHIHTSRNFDLVYK